MAKKPNITTIASGYYSRQALNSNFEDLRDAFDNTLSLDGSTPNAMGADLDMNNNDILNAKSLNTKSLRLEGVLVSASDLGTTGASLFSDNYVGNGSTVAYTMSYEPFIKDNTQVYIDGVYQNKNGYSVSGTTLTFSAAPPLNADIEIVVARNLEDIGTTDAAVVTYSQGSSGAVTNTVEAKLQEVVSIKDFGAVCDGVTDDTVAVFDAIAAVGGNLTTLVVSGPTKISAALTFNINTQVKFYSGGQFIGTSGTEVVTLQRQPDAGFHQIFNNVDPYFTTGMTLLPEWFGAVKDGSTDDRTAFQDAFRSVRNVGGVIQLNRGNYAISDGLSIDYNHITIQGAGNNNSTILVTGTNKNGIIINGTPAARLRNIMLRDFSIRLVTDATAACIGVYSYYNAYPIIERMQIQDFLFGLKMEGSTNSQFTKIGATYTGATNGFIGFDIYGGATSAATGGNQSSILKDCYASGVHGLTGQMGFKFHGGYMSDLQFDTCETAETTYGFYFDYSAAPDFNVDAIIRNPIVDRFYAQGIFINGLAKNGVMQIIGGYSNPEADNTQNMYFNNCQGATTVIGHQFMALQNATTTDGFYAVNSNHITIGNCTFTKLNRGVALNTCGYSTINGNIFLGGNPSSFSKSVEVITGARVMVNNNVFAGTGQAVIMDATSSGCGIVGNTANLNTVGVSFTNQGSGPIGGANGGTGLNSGI